jgi:hypothetical protein
VKITASAAILFVAFFACFSCLAQAPAAPAATPAFDVASIRPHVGAMRPDIQTSPGSLIIRNQTLLCLITLATGGPKFKESTDEGPPVFDRGGPTTLTAHRVSMKDLAYRFPIR